MTNKIEIGDLIYIKTYCGVYLVGHPRPVSSMVTIKEGYQVGDCTLSKLGSKTESKRIGGCNPYHRIPCVWNSLEILNDNMAKGNIKLISKNIVEIFNKVAKKVK